MKELCMVVCMLLFCFFVVCFLSRTQKSSCRWFLFFLTFFLAPDLPQEIPRIHYSIRAKNFIPGTKQEKVE